MNNIRKRYQGSTGTMYPTASSHDVSVATSASDDSEEPTTAVSSDNKEPDLTSAHQKTYADIIYPLTKDVNIYAIIPIMFYVAAVSTGHLSTKDEFWNATFAFMISEAAVFIVSFIKKKF